MNLKQELENRGFIYQFSDEKLFELYEKGGQSLYCGVDPTANSLHLGNFVLFMAAINYMKRGNKFFLLVGGATGMIGDPGGKDSERNFLDEQTLANNQKAITTQVQGILNHLTEMTGQNFEFEVVNNYDFYKNMNALEYLREVGKFVTVNQMISKDTVKRRVEDPSQSISYTEFSYMMLQGYDFFKLYSDRDVKLQIGGQDQWGNLVTGVEIIRKKSEKEAYAMTFPLITDSTGKKFGKSEGNAIWLDENKNSPYFVYQYFINTNDEDVERFLKLLTLLDFDNIDNIVKQHMEAPEQRYGQKQLAKYVVETIFGKQAAASAEKVSEILFGRGDKLEMLSNMDNNDIEALAKETGKFEISGEITIIDALVESGLVTSKGEARKMIKGNGISLNEEKVTDENMTINKDNLINGQHGLLRKGKKNYITIVMN